MLAKHKWVARKLVNVDRTADVRWGKKERKKAKDENLTPYILHRNLIFKQVSKKERTIVIMRSFPSMLIIRTHLIKTLLFFTCRIDVIEMKGQKHRDFELLEGMGMTAIGGDTLQRNCSKGDQEDDVECMRT